MNTLDAKSLTTGFVAGITAALLVLGAAAQPTLASILYAASALPVLIVGLGWGNAAAITLYERCGFRHEGRRRRARLLDGVAEDVVEMALNFDETPGP